MLRFREIAALSAVLPTFALSCILTGCGGSATKTVSSTPPPTSGSTGTPGSGSSSGGTGSSSGGSGSGSGSGGGTGGSGGGTGGGGNVTCPTVAFAVNQGPTGLAPFPDPVPTPPPLNGNTSSGTLCITSPAANATVTSPVLVQAPVVMSAGVDHEVVYVDSVPLQYTYFVPVEGRIWMDPGSHRIDVVSFDHAGNSISQSVQVTVVPPQTPSIGDIQTLPNWEACSKLFPSGHPRSLQTCAEGPGDAVVSLTQNLSSPTPVSGSGNTVAQFTLGGTGGYKNELWTRFLGGGQNVSKFTYDVYFMVDHVERSQALEFDTNQAFGNRRWVFGTECNFKGAGNPIGQWDVWDGVHQWQRTTVPCNPADFPPGQWNHLVWQYERVGEQVHYISVTVNGHTYPVDLYMSNEPYWTLESIDVAFQMDGDYAQEPYTVWLDKLTLTAQ